MEIKYFVAEAYRYLESQKWEYKMVGMYDTLKEAKKAYGGRMNAIIKDSNDISMVILYDSLGNKILSDYEETPAPEPVSA